MVRVHLCPPSTLIVALCDVCRMVVKRELAQMARALGLGPRGREFESRIPESLQVYCTIANAHHKCIILYDTTSICYFF